MSNYGSYFAVHTATSGMHWSTDTAYVAPPAPSTNTFGHWADTNDLDFYVELAVMTAYAEHN